MVDSVSRKPISGASVDQYTVHQTGRKRFEEDEKFVGSTNTSGIFKVKELNMRSRIHTFSFQKSGYKTMIFITRELSGQNFGVYSVSGSKKNCDKIAITPTTVVTIPMRRK
jgi:hypothetical protein